MYICGVGVVAVAAALFLDILVQPTLTKKPQDPSSLLQKSLKTGDSSTQCALLLCWCGLGVCKLGCVVFFTFSSSAIWYFYQFLLAPAGALKSWIIDESVFEFSVCIQFVLATWLETDMPCLTQRVSLADLKWTLCTPLAGCGAHNKPSFFTCKARWCWKMGAWGQPILLNGWQWHDALTWSLGSQGRKRD